jgi:hypothetical protein
VPAIHSQNISALPNGQRRHEGSAASSLVRALLLLTIAAVPARAADPGTVKGTFTILGKPVELKYAYAHFHDNEEGLLDRPKELRILLTDREVAPEMLYGIAFLPVTDLARAGTVQGLLLTLDPAKPNSAVGTLLAKPQQPGESLTNTTYTAEPKLFKRWSFTPQRVSGELDQLKEYDPDLPNLTAVSFAVEFSAPIVNEPAVTADLKGPAARTSAPVQTLTRCAGLLAAGDVGGANKLQSVRSLKSFEEAKLSPAQASKLAKEAGADLRKALPRIQRVVVRGGRAVAIINANEYYSLVQEGGVWKMDF